MPKKYVLEKDIRDPVVKWARANDFLVRKMNGQFNAGWPDDMFVFKGGVAWIEFKRPGKYPTPLQSRMLAKLQLLGQHAEWFDDVQSAIKFLKGASGWKD